MIINTTPDIGAPEGQLCLGRWYRFEETEDALKYFWSTTTRPQNVDAEDVKFSNGGDLENMRSGGRFTYVRVPVTGQYCFNVTRLVRK